MAESQYQYEQFRDKQLEPVCFHTEDNSFFPHFHNAIELMYVQEGSIQAIVNGCNMKVTANQLIIVPCFSIHSFSTPDHSSSISLIIPLSYLGLYEKLFQTHTFCRYLLASPESVTRIRWILLRLADEKSPVNPVLKRGLIYEVLGLLMEEIPMKEQSKGDPLGRLQMILSFLQENFTKPITLETVSHRFGYSKSRFSHLFNEAAGCSLPHYLNMLRTKHVIRLVQEDDYSMMDAAMASGYESMRSFYRAFRQIYGCTPSEYLSDA